MGEDGLTKEQKAYLTANNGPTAVPQVSPYDIGNDSFFKNYLEQSKIDYLPKGTIKTLENLGNGGNGLGNTPAWTYQGALDSLGGLAGTNGKTLQDIGGVLGDTIGFGNTLFGMYNKNQGLKLAKDDYNFQKGLTLKKIAQADADRNRFLSNQKAATAQYYGK